VASELFSSAIQNFVAALVSRPLVQSVSVNRKRSWVTGRWHAESASPYPSWTFRPSKFGTRGDLVIASSDEVWSQCRFVISIDRYLLTAMSKYSLVFATYFNLVSLRGSRMVCYIPHTMYACITLLGMYQLDDWPVATASLLGTNALSHVFHPCYLPAEYKSAISSRQNSSYQSVLWKPVAWFWFPLHFSV